MARVSKNQSRLRAFALVGARARLEELRKEESTLRADFPELFRGGRGSAASTGSAGPARSRGGRRAGRRTMSAAQKKAVSERMKRYWAERRKAEQ